jgi:DNA mismatch repair protein MutS2
MIFGARDEAMPLDNKVLHTLEYFRIIEMLCGQTSTSLGRELAEQLTPSGDYGEVGRRLAVTDEAVAVLRLKGSPPFGGIRDIRSGVFRAAKGGMLHGEELLEIADTIVGGHRVKAFLQGLHSEPGTTDEETHGGTGAHGNGAHGNGAYGKGAGGKGAFRRSGKEGRPIPELFRISSQIVELKELDQKIRQCIDENAQVRDHASPELARVRADIRTGEARVRERLEQIVRSAAGQKMLQDQIITIRNDRYVIPVKQEYRSHFGGIVHDQSASGATLFIEPESVVELNNRLRELHAREKREVEKILLDLSRKVGEHAEQLQENAEALGKLDFIFAKAGLAYALKASRPLLNDRGFIRLKRARHPLLDPARVVPIDVELGDEATAIIITGPNTGGKTVTLKTVGLLSLMAASGLFIPAEDGSEMCVFDAVYADIGDEQSIEQSLSTFSSHMSNIIRILRNMTPKSLVLLDELGAGTDPAEGSALAISLLEYIHGMGCRVIATTHYSELKAYAYEREGVLNASMEFDIRTLSPTYRLLVGVPGRSNAFAIAERLGLSRRIIEEARKRLGEDEQRVETMIASLEENRVTAEAERQTAERLRREVESLRAQLAEEKRKFAEQKEKLMRKAEQEARSIVERARREADEIIAELRRMAMEEQASIKEHKLAEARRRLNEAEPDLPVRRRESRPAGRKTRPPEPGDEVLVRSLGQKGAVLDVSGKEAQVQIGVLKMKVPLDDLELVETKHGKAEVKVAATVRRARPDQVRTELDLRGATLEDAVLEVSKFLDEAMLANLGTVRIIHGKGTGVLRQGIQENLRRHKHVKSFRLGEIGEGGSGVTVVELR